MSGSHFETKEVGFYAFCHRNNRIESVGPYSSYYEALRVLALTKDCVHCKFNQSIFKDAYLPFLDERIKEYMVNKFGIDASLKLKIDSLNNYIDARQYLNENFRDKFGFALFQKTDISPSIAEIIKPIKGRTDFLTKIQALALTVNLEENKLINQISMPQKDTLKGSLLILEQFFKENVVDFPSVSISKLRTLMSLRNYFPAHNKTTNIISDLKVLGVSEFPPKDWEKTISVIINECSECFDRMTSKIKEK